MVKRKRRTMNAECGTRKESTSICFRSGRTTWAVLAFLLLFAILIVCVSHFYLLPALAVVKDANPGEKLRLEAYSRLLLAIVLFILVVGLMLTFRIGRFFFPRPRTPKVQTKYVDAWTEAGRRAQSPPNDPPH
jgi:hypothetical protein